MIEYHPYDLDIDGETGINAKNMQRIEAELEGRKRITFAVISDTQRWYDETEEAVESLNGQKDLDFVVHTGDLSDFGLKLEFEKQRDILNRLSVPYVCILGNHDCLATGEEVFNRIFGENTTPGMSTSCASTPMPLNSATTQPYPTSSISETTGRASRKE